jgi:hypothetical protein
MTVPQYCLTSVLWSSEQVTDFGYPRACRFKKHQIENRFPELALPTFLKTWFFVHKMWLKMAKKWRTFGLTSPSAWCALWSIIPKCVSKSCNFWDASQSFTRAIYFKKRTQSHPIPIPKPSSNSDLLVAWSTCRIRNGPYFFRLWENKN